MNIRFLETLVWLTRLRNFTRAAEKLNTTQPAISIRINKLEELLGVELYDRNERRFELTAAGRRILPHAEQVVKLVAELRDMARRDDELDTPLSIGVIESVTMSWLPRFIRDVSASLPTATLYFGTGTSRQLIQELRDDTMNLIFVVGPLDEPNIVTCPICTTRQDWVANPSHFDCDSEIDVVDLSRLPVVLQRTGSSGYDTMIDYFRGYGIENIPSRDRKLTINCAYSLVTAVEIVKAGLAIMPLPSILCRADFAGRQLAPMRIRQSLPLINVFACWKPPLASPLIHRLIDLSIKAASDYAETCEPHQMWAAGAPEGER